MAVVVATIVMVTGSFDDVGRVDGRFRRWWRLLATVTITTVMATCSFDDCGPRMKKIGVIFK